MALKFHYIDQLPLQKTAELRLVCFKKIGVFENIFRDVWAKFKIQTLRNFEKMPTIDTLDALGDAMTSILTTNLAQDMP